MSGESYALLCALLWSGAVILFRLSGARTPPVALNLFKNTVGLSLITLTLLLLGLTSAYLVHYFRLENGVQRWYHLQDRLDARLPPRDAHA